MYVPYTHASLLRKLDNIFYKILSLAIHKDSKLSHKIKNSTAYFARGMFHASGNTYFFGNLGEHYEY